MSHEGWHSAPDPPQRDDMEINLIYQDVVPYTGERTQSAGGFRINEESDGETSVVTVTMPLAWWMIQSLLTIWDLMKIVLGIWTFLKAKRMVESKNEQEELNPRRGALEKCIQTKGHYLRDYKKPYVKDLDSWDHGVWEEWLLSGTKKLICVNDDIEKSASPGARIYGINAREWLNRAFEQRGPNAE